jgi:hypothetical protein
LAEDGSWKELIGMLSFLTDELVWAAIREREDEARNTHPHTAGWPQTERSMAPPKAAGRLALDSPQARASGAGIPVGD